MTEFTNTLTSLAARPGDAESRGLAEHVVAMVRAGGLDRDERELLLQNVVIFAAIGLGSEMLDAVRLHREELSEIVDTLEVLLNVTEKPAAATYALRDETESAELKGVRVVNAFLRGDLAGALSFCEEADWFMDDVASANGFGYAVWMLGLSDRLDEAEVLLQEWKQRNAGKNPGADHQVARTEAVFASYRADFDHEVRVLEEALFIAEATGSGLDAAFAETALAAAYAHAGEFELAEELSAAWVESPSGNLLGTFRNLALADVALLSGRWDEVEAHTDRVFDFFSARRNPILMQHARFVRALAATPEDARGELDDFARSVARLPTRRMGSRVEDLERLWSAGVRDPRTARVRERTHHRTTQRALARVWYPRSASRADLYFDRVRGVIFVRGRGPYDMTRFPKRFELLEHLATSEHMSASIGDVFAAVWGMPYDARLHENKMHVTVHRLRHLLAEWGRDPDLDLVQIRDGAVSLAAADVRVLEVEGELWAPSSLPLDQRILNLLRPGEKQSAGELERSLAVSRASLHLALRRLVASGEVQRSGGGRSIRYQLTT